MDDHPLKVLIAPVKAKITPIVTKVRRWTSWKFIRTKLICTVRDTFSSLCNFSPRDKEDYYEIFSWMVSRRLAFALTAAAGAASLLYLISLKSFLGPDVSDGIKTYPYHSVMLRFAKDKVRITGKGRYLAYEGEVEGGSVTGYGTLYNRDGAVVYQGNFYKNRYQGDGTCYYSSGAVYYTGNFQENLFDGSGKLYRENGSLEYEGEFSLGKKEGTGKLYDDGTNLVYTGGFSQDAILYSDLLGKKVSEMADIYSGKQTLYEESGHFAVVLEDIEAMYLSGDAGQSLDDEMTVDTVLVMKKVFEAGGRSYASVEELRRYFEEELYEGNSEITMPEAVAMNWLADKGENLYEKVKMETALSSDYEDYVVISDYDRRYTVYLYSFQKDGLIYTFACHDRGGGFSFYSIEKSG